MAALDALEAQWRAQHEVADVGYYAASYSSWLSYGTGLLADVAQNLQLQLGDVHLRYEDDVTRGTPFALGLRLDALRAESCDSEWRPGPARGDCDAPSYKLLQLRALAAYWEEDGRHADMLLPAEAEARVRRERTERPLRSRTRPRLHCALTLPRVDVQLAAEQWRAAAECSRGLRRIARLRADRALRPSEKPSSRPRAWWLYALRAHRPDTRWPEPRPDWESCLRRARLVRDYVDVCLGLLTEPAAALSPRSKALKDDLEWSAPLSVLRALREAAMRRVPRGSPAAAPSVASGAGRGMLLRWFPQWWGWYGPAAPDGAEQPPPPDLEEEILDVIADSLENDTLLKRDTVFGQFEFLLSDGHVILDEGGAARLELQFSGVSAGLSSRPRASSHSLTLAVGDVRLLDRMTPRTLFPALVAPQGTTREGLSALNASAAAAARVVRPSETVPASPPAEPLFRLTYEKNPSGFNCEHR